MKKITVIIHCLICCIIVAACNNSNNTTADVKPVKDSLAKDTGRHVEILDPEGNKFLDANATVDVLAGGFAWTEGALYVADGDYFLFSDIPNNKVYKWKDGGDTSLFLTPSGFTGIMLTGTKGGSNGLILDKKGQLVLMQEGDRRIARMKAPITAPKADFITLADNYGGKHLNSPNDGVFAANGDFYFTDPPYGLKKGIQDSAKELSFQGVMLLRPNGKVEVVTDELKYPNGIALTPDGKNLLIGNSDGDNKVWMRYELNEKGLMKSSSVFYKPTPEEAKANGSPDGMKMSKDGYLFATGPGGVWIFNPAGKPIARIYTGDLTANCALGKDEKILFMNCNSYVMRVRLK